MSVSPSTEHLHANEGGASVRVTIERIDGAGVCSIGHRVGDSWLVDSALAPSGMCGWAYVAMAPFLQVLRFGGEFPWGSDKDVCTVCCPDPDNPVVFRAAREK